MRDPLERPRARFFFLSLAGVERPVSFFFFFFMFIFVSSWNKIMRVSCCGTAVVGSFHLLRVVVFDLSVRALKNAFGGAHNNLTC